MIGMAIMCVTDTAIFSELTMPNAWDLQLKAALYDIGNDPENREDDRPLYHRQGEAYLMENSWITGDETPNDPFHTRIRDGQVDVLKTRFRWECIF